MNTLFSRFTRTARARAGAPALIAGEQTLGYDRLLGAAARLSVRLAAAGVTRGGRVAVAFPNGPDFVRAFFAVARLGAVAVPLNPSLREEEMGAIMGEGEVSAALVAAGLRDRCVAALAASVGAPAEAVIVPGEEDGRPPSDTVDDPALGDAASADAPVLYLYSSGTTGRPKRIARTHAHLLYEIDRLAAAIGLGHADRVLGVAPFSHTNGLLRSMLASVLAGATLVTLPDFERRAVGRVIEEHRVTVFIGVPFMFAMLADTRWPRPVDFSSLRLCASSSAPLRRETAQRFRERYGLPVRQLYGCTETGTIALDLRPADEVSVDSVGLPLDGVSVEIFADDRSPRPTGETGDIGIRSPAGIQGYPGLPEQNRTSFSNGYFFPGDVGYKDSDGRIYLLGRKSLFINRGGFKVNPYEVETALEQHPKVAEAAVIGVETEFGDQKIKAVVVTREPCEMRELIEFCRARMADFKVPSIIEFRGELPKNSAGKILRKKLEA